MKKTLLCSLMVLLLLSGGLFSENPAGSFNKSLLVPEKEQETIPPNRGKAFLFSLLLPGAGEYYAGHTKMAKIFLGTEVLIWATYFTFKAYGQERKDDYRRFAMAHAGIDPQGKDHHYFVNIEHFDTIREYNEEKLRQRNVAGLYPENSEYAWQWDSQKNRLKYEKIRESSDQAFSRATLVIGAVVLNHLISGIDAIRLVNKEVEENPVKVGFVPRPEGGMQVMVCKVF